ncbi:hypothetical protein QJQ45_016453, partial [Haematococcus lacustris]
NRAPVVVISKPGAVCVLSETMQTSIHRRACKPGCGSSSAPRVARANPRPVLRSVADDLASANGATAHAPVIDFDELSDIIRMVHDTDIIELDLKSKKFNLSLKKKEALQVEQVVQYVQQQPAATMAAPAPASQPASPAPPAAAPAPAPAPAPMTPSVQKIEGIELTSPMAGTFYKASAVWHALQVSLGSLGACCAQLCSASSTQRGWPVTLCPALTCLQAAAPGEAPFVKAGDKVKKGQVVGIVEAMKLMNEIEAEFSGEVVKVLLENGSPVTVGTVANHLDPAMKGSKISHISQGEPGPEQGVAVACKVGWQGRSELSSLLKRH